MRRMPLDLRYFWSTSFVKERLREARLTEAASFRYFLAVMAFDWLQFTLIATTQTPSVSPWSAASAWASLAITLLGLPYLYRRNGGGTGQYFFRRYFPLSIVVGWKFVVAMVVALWFVPVVLAGQSDEMLGWSAAVMLALINITMFWRIGFHLASLADAPGISRSINRADR